MAMKDQYVHMEEYREIEYNIIELVKKNKLLEQKIDMLQNTIRYKRWYDYGKS
jgi:hypothetical protein